MCSMILTRSIPIAGSRRINAMSPSAWESTCVSAQHIARAQLQEGLHQIAQRMRSPRLAGKFGWRPYPGTWGLKGLPIEFAPAPATETVEA